MLTFFGGLFMAWIGYKMLTAKPKNSIGKVSKQLLEENKAQAKLLEEQRTAALDLAEHCIHRLEAVLQQRANANAMPKPNGQDELTQMVAMDAMAQVERAKAAVIALAMKLELDEKQIGSLLELIDEPEKANKK